MSAPPFTPGEWIANVDDRTIQTADGKLDIAMVFDDGTCPVEQLKADVHLLGASKALYEALRAMVGDTTPHADGYRPPSRDCTLAVAQAALAQAEGRR